MGDFLCTFLILYSKPSILSDFNLSDYNSLSSFSR